MGLKESIRQLGHLGHELRRLRIVIEYVGDRVVAELVRLLKVPVLGGAHWGDDRGIRQPSDIGLLSQVVSFQGLARMLLPAD